MIVEFLLADLFQIKGEYENADKLYGQRFPLLRTEFERENIEPQFFTGVLNDYAILCRAHGDSVKAEALLRESLALSAQYSVTGKADMARGFLTLILLDQGKFGEAQNLQQDVVNRFRNQANHETPEFCAALTLLGSILMEQGDLSGAAKNLREGEELYRKLYGPNHTAIYDNLRLQAQVSYLAGKYAEAEATINRVLEHYRQNASPKYISFATALTVQGLVLTKLGKSDEAEKVLREAVKLRDENLPNKHFMTALTKGALGECLTIEKRYDEAEALLQASYKDLKASQGEQNPRTILAWQRLLKLYEAWGKPDEAKKLQ